MLSALWGILNGVFAPIVFRMFGFPILCDMIGFAALSLTFWWVRKLGAVSIVGTIATAINFALNTGGVHFLGFTAASFVFDLAVNLMGYRRVFHSGFLATASLLSISVLSATVAGLIIGSFLMAAAALAGWGGVLGWAGLHAAGGLIGGFIGVALIASLSARNIRSVGLQP